MADRHQRLSHHLWEILDRSGVSERMRASAVRMGLTREIVLTVMTMLIQNTNQSNSMYICGSSSEGATTPDLNSDLDTVHVNEDLPVVNNLRDAGAGFCLLPIWDSNTAPGYAKLQLVYDGTSWDIHTKPLVDLQDPMTRFDNAGRLVLTNSIKEMICWYVSKQFTVGRHGPAIIMQRYFPIDLVMAYPCSSWPHLATEWLHRKREHNWPPSNMIHMAETMGCLFVPVGHPYSCEASLEWRLSFSLQERQLMFHLNEVQHKCYVLLKFIKSDIIEADIKGDSITSYHLKTCLFYCIERTRADFWQRYNLVRCLIYCLGTLLHWLRRGYCPNYFIKEQNMFRGKLDRQVRERSLRLLDGIVSGTCIFLLKIKCNDIGKQLMAYLRRRSIDTRAIMFRTVLYKLRIYLNAYSDCHRVAINLLNHCLTSRNMDIASCIQSHETLLRKLYRMKTVSQHTETETRAALQYITPFIHTSLACHLVIQVIQTTGSRMSIRSNTRIQEHLSKGLEANLLSTRLKHSAIYYRLADYETVERILLRAENDCMPSLSNLCSCVRNINTFWTYGTWLLVSTDTLDGHVSFCVRFLPTEIAITPTPLQYEMFRYVGTRPPLPNEEMKYQMKERHDVAAVDATVFLHCMRYLVYSKKHDNSQKDLALVQLKSMITKHVDDINHMGTAWNILGWIYRKEHDTSNAMECFKKSMALEPLHNAAKWQIAELCFEQLTNAARLDTGN